MSLDFLAIHGLKLGFRQKNLLQEAALASLEVGRYPKEGQKGRRHKRCDARNTDKPPFPGKPNLVFRENDCCLGGGSALIHARLECQH